jgi:hypothetical protein
VLLFVPLIEVPLDIVPRLPVLEDNTGVANMTWERRGRIVSPLNGAGYVLRGADRAARPTTLLMAKRKSSPFPGETSEHGKHLE